jgi:hypothetical protein
MAEKRWNDPTVTELTAGNAGDGSGVTAPGALANAKRWWSWATLKTWLESNLTLAQARITGLGAALGAKSDVGHGHTVSNISDFGSAFRSLLGSLLQAGANITITQDGGTGVVTIEAAGGGGGGLDAEAVRDTIAAALVAGSGITITVNDPANTITITLAAHTHNMADIADAAVLSGTLNQIVMFDENGDAQARSLAYMTQTLLGSSFSVGSFSTTRPVADRTIFVAEAADVGRKWVGLGQASSVNATTITAKLVKPDNLSVTHINAAVVDATPDSIVIGTPPTLALGDRIVISTPVAAGELRWNVLLGY